jgi:hypothetical protein
MLQLSPTSRFPRLAGYIYLHDIDTTIFLFLEALVLRP